MSRKTPEEIAKVFSLAKLVYLAPFTSGAAAYCFSHTVEHPSIAIALGVFFVCCSITLVVRQIAITEST
jgi:hypothetical protein